MKKGLLSHQKTQAPMIRELWKYSKEIKSKFGDNFSILDLIEITEHFVRIVKRSSWLENVRHGDIGDRTSLCHLLLLLKSLYQSCKNVNEALRNQYYKMMFEITCVYIDIDVFKSVRSGRESSLNLLNRVLIVMQSVLPPENQYMLEMFSKLKTFDRNHKDFYKEFVSYFRNKLLSDPIKMDNIRFLQYLLIFNFQIKNIDSSDREKKIRFVNDMLDFMKSNNIDDVQIRRQLYLENEDVYSLFRVKRTKIKEALCQISKQHSNETRINDISIEIEDSDSELDYWVSEVENNDPVDLKYLSQSLKMAMQPSEVIEISDDDEEIIPKTLNGQFCFDNPTVNLPDHPNHAVTGKINNNKKPNPPTKVSTAEKPAIKQLKRRQVLDAYKFLPLGCKNFKRTRDTTKYAIPKIKRSSE